MKCTCEFRHNTDNEQYYLEKDLDPEFTQTARLASVRCELV